ncbi:MAG: CRISPR-associated RAMP protein Csx10 [Anaerolineae bacterium]|nr:CRISPR-associated RAMP protein Csx10 [Anaerolineae bacterium]
MARKALNFTIEVLTPLMISAFREASILHSLNYVPGVAIRGSLANLLLAGCPESKAQYHFHSNWPPAEREKCPFYRVFYALEAPVFLNAYPGLARPALPLPATAHSCKLYEGFRSAGLKQHGVFDTLVHQAVFEQALDGGQPLPYIYEPKCWECTDGDRKTEAISGRFYMPRVGKYTSAKPFIRRFSRTAIGRGRATASEGQLYTLEVVGEEMELDEEDAERRGEKTKPRTRFQGRVLADENVATILRQYLPKIRWLGSGRSRGLGQVLLDAPFEEELPAAPSSEQIGKLLEELAAEVPFAPQGSENAPPRDLVRRIIAFNRLWRVEWSSYVQLGALPPEGAWYFTVGLTADAILGDGGAATLRLEPKHLGAAFTQGVSLVRSWTGHRTVGGWSSAIGLPKEMELAVPMGSVFLYRVEARDGATVQAMITALAELENQGIGAHREVGYGQVQICSPFHLEVKAL